MRFLIIALTAVLLAACSTTPVIMVHEDGRVRQCGPYSNGKFREAEAAAMHETQCVKDYKEQGFKRE